MSSQRPRAERLPKSKLDWSLVDAGLSAVPEAYLDERFYPLKHVVEVFSAKDPEAVTLDLREKEDRLIELVDLVVQGYHSGFARSIQNFSLILQLFVEATSQVQVMKKATREASRTLSAQSRSLMGQWRRKVSLESSVELLDQVVDIVKAPARIESALESKDWTLAVDLLASACYDLAHGHLSRVMALRKLRSDMVNLSRKVQLSLFEELKDSLFAMAAPQQVLTSQPKVNSKTPHGPSDSKSSSPNGNGALALRGGAGRRLAMAVALGKDVASGRSFIIGGGGRGLGGGISSPMANKSILPSLGAPSSAAISKGSVWMRGGSSSESHLVQIRRATIKEVVSCLSRLDAVEEAMSFVRYHVREEVKNLVSETLARSSEGAKAVLASLSSSSSDADCNQPKRSVGVDLSSEALARRTIQELSDASLKALSTCRPVFESLSEAERPYGHNLALEMLKVLVEDPMVPEALSSEGKWEAAGEGEDDYEQHMGTGQAVNKRLMGGLRVRAWPLAKNLKAMLAAEEEREKKSSGGSHPNGRPSRGGAGSDSNSNSNRGPQSKALPLPSPSADPMLSPEQRADYLRSEICHLWAQMQEEWIVVLADLIKMTPRTMGSLADFSLGMNPRAGSGPASNGPSLDDSSSYGLSAFMGGIDSVQAGASKVANELTRINGWILNMAEVAEQVLGGNISAVTPLGQQKILIEQDRKRMQRRLDMEEAREEAQRAHKAKHTLSFHFDLTSSDQHSSLDRHLPPSLLPTSSSKRFFDASNPLTPAGGVSISGVPGEEVGGQRARLGYPATLTRALGGAAASALLTPTLLPLLLHFLDRGSSLVFLSAPKRIDFYTKGAASNQPSSSPAPLGFRSIKGSGGGSVVSAATQALINAAEEREARAARWLRVQVEGHVTDRLLPLMAQELKTSCVQALDAADALKAPSSLSIQQASSSASSSDLGGGGRVKGALSPGWEGRPVLPASSFIESTLRDIDHWCESMPSYEPQILALAEGVLNRALGAFASCLLSLLSSSSSSSSSSSMVLSNLLEDLNSTRGSGGAMHPPPPSPSSSKAPRPPSASPVSGWRGAFRPKASSESVGGAGLPLAWRLASRPDVSHLMAFEPDAPMLSSVPHAFCPPRPDNLPDGLLPSPSSHSSKAATIGGSSTNGLPPPPPTSPTSHLQSAIHGLGQIGSTLASSTKAQIALGLGLGGTGGGGSSQDPNHLMDPESFVAALGRGGGGGMIEGQGERGMQGTMRDDDEELNADRSVNFGSLAAAGRGFANGGSRTESLCLSLLFQSLSDNLAASSSSFSPSPSSLLLCGQGQGLETHRAVAMAALSEGLDYIADSILTVLADKRGGLLPQVLVELGQRFRSLSCLIARSLRLELHLQTLALLRPLFQANQVLDGPEDAKELHPCIGALVRVMTRLSKDIGPQFRPMRAAYVVGGVGSCASRSVMWSLESCDEMNVFGIDRMIKTLSTLHLSLGHLTPELASIASSILVSSSEALSPNQPNLIEDYFLEDEEEDIVTAIKRGNNTQGTVDRKRGVDVRGGGGVGEEGRLGVKGWNKVRRHLLPLLAAEVKSRREREASIERSRLLRSKVKLPSDCTPLELLEGWAVRAGRTNGHARAFYSLLRLHVEDIIQAASERPRRFSRKEWESLLIADISRRLVRVAHMDKLREALSEGLLREQIARAGGGHSKISKTGSAKHLMSLMRASREKNSQEGKASSTLPGSELGGLIAAQANRVTGALKGIGNALNEVGGEALSSLGNAGGSAINTIKEGGGKIVGRAFVAPAMKLREALGALRRQT